MCSSQGVSPAAEVTQEAALAAAERLPPDAPRFLLGSASKPRGALLSATGASFDVMKPDIDEKAIGDRAAGDAEALVRLLAEAKADALLGRLQGAADDRVLLTGDQVVTYRGQIREKPRDAAQVREFIAGYASAPCTTVGAQCLHDQRSGCRVVGVQVAHIHFAPSIADAAVLDALASDERLLSCAGGLMVEHPLVAKHVERVEGGVDAVMGLSTSLLKEMLVQLHGQMASCDRYGLVLGNPGLRTWAVVGDCTNAAKPAFRVVQRLEGAGRRVLQVSPYDQSGACFADLVAIRERVDAVNLIISPSRAPEVLRDMSRLGIRHVFMQPGADTQPIVQLAKELGLTFQRGCVLVSDMAPLAASG